jgi:branched-chain amino acid transport system ATP-binding protein
VVPPGAADGHRLIARGVRVHFAGVKALDGVDLELSQTEILGLIGPNGAGKTTLVNVITGFQPSNAGSLSIGRRHVTGWSPARLARHGVARTFQSVRVFSNLTVTENLEAAALGAGKRRRAARRRAAEVLELLGLSHTAQLAPTALAAGTRRLVGIARALTMDPRFLLLDEPTAGLNEEESDELTDAVAKSRAELGCGVLLIEHDMRVVMGLSERVQVLDNGTTLAIGTPDEIRRNQDVIRAYLGDESSLASGNGA